MTPSASQMTDLRLHRPRISTWWWTRKRTYFVFVMRELSSIFVAWCVVYLVLFVYAVGRGEAAYQRFLDWASSPWVTALNVVALVFVLLHTVTWFNLTPQAMAVRVMGRRVPDFHIIAGQYTGLVVVSGFVLWLVTR
ncbi:fumarate reductase subunit C [Blastococcus deserti]|uniref:Fumarate reductase subunit C n=1 Tax=Blastococcus deserti TaxID=2259033 RepID=A0ABW4X810_9ACTN